MAKGRNGGGSKEGRRSRPAKGGELDPTQEELQRALAQTSSPKIQPSTEVPPRDQDKDEVAQETAPVPEVSPKVREHEVEVQEEITARIPDRPDVEVKPPQIRTQRFAPRGSRMRNYDEDGRPAIQPDTRVYSKEPEIKKEPELSRKRSRTQTPPAPSIVDASDFIQVETDPAKMVSIEKQSETVARPPRIRSKVVPVDEGPFIQVETKLAFKEKKLEEEMLSAIDTYNEAAQTEEKNPMPAVFRSNRGRPKSSEATVISSSELEQLHEPIDFGKELKNIRSGTKEEQRQKLADFKEKLIEQKKGIAEIQKKLFEEVEKNPDAEVWEYLDVVKDLQEKHDLNDEQRFAIEKGLEAYNRTHKAIREKTEDCIAEDGKVDGSKLYEKIFNQKPKGRVEVILRPAVIYVRIEDLDDYAAAYNHGAVDQVTNEMKGEADSSGGCLLNNIPGLEGAVALEKATNGRFDNMDEYSNVTLQHEEQHAFNKIINRGYSAEWERDLTNKDLDEIIIESQVKDEISAFFRDGHSAEDIRRTLLNPSTIYKYGFEYGREDKGKTEFSQKYVDLVENGIQAYADLLEAGHSKEDVQALLFVEPLSKWSKTTERLLGEDKTEGTPKEWREKLRGLIMGATEKIGWYKSSEEKLIRRKEELRVEAEKIGGVEGFFRKMGEDYNKLGWKSKLAIGAALGLGAGISAAALLPEALVLCVTGIAAQRTAGLMSMYLKFEKASPPYGGEREKKFWQWGQKEKAMGKAILYTTAMSLGMGYAVKEIGETEWARATQEKIQHTVQGWLGTMLGHHTIPPSEVQYSESTTTEVPHTATGVAATDAAPTPVPAESATGAEVPHTTAAAVAPEHPTIPAGHQASADVQYQAMRAVETGHQASADVQAAALRTAESNAATLLPEMPTVGASAHGYEGMMKDLLKHLPDTKPENIPDGSDLAKLYEAKASTDPEAIGRAIHKIAMDPGHKFFTDGGSVRIDTNAHMTVDASTGNILFNGEVQAPVNAHFTQTLPTETPVAHVAEPLSTVTSAEAAEGIVITEEPAEPLNAAEPFISPETPVVSAETPPIIPVEMLPTPAPEVQPLPAETIIAPDTTVTTVNAPESVSEPHVETPPANAAEATATQAPVPVVEQGFISNQLGLKIPVAEPHLYIDPAAKEVFAYGGSPMERAKSMLEYLTANPNKVVFAADDSGKYRIPWHLVEGKLTPGAPIRTSGFFGLFSSFMKAPEPEEFAKLIK